jgi:hypothetical protein
MYACNGVRSVHTHVVYIERRTSKYFVQYLLTHVCNIHPCTYILGMNACFAGRGDGGGRGRGGMEGGRGTFNCVLIVSYSAWLHRRVEQLVGPIKHMRDRCMCIICIMYNHLSLRVLQVGDQRK